MDNFLEFKIPDAYLEKYAQAEPAWGFGVLSELVFLRTYSRTNDAGGKERWWEVARRVVEGTLDIQKKYSKMFNLHWDEDKALRTALEMYDSLYNFKWSPAGRGLVI